MADDTRRIVEGHLRSEAARLRAELEVALKDYEEKRKLEQTLSRYLAAYETVLESLGPGEAPPSTGDV